MYVLYTDASAKGVGGVLSVFREGTNFPVGFYSRQLRGAEKICSH